MSRKVHITNDDAENNGLRTAVLVTLIAGLTLVLLSTAVFSLAATTRSLSTDAEHLHTTDESLRAATTARAQLALGLHGSRVDNKIGSDSSASVSASINEAELALGGFSQSVALLDKPEVDGPADKFLSAAAASVTSIREPTTESERNQIDGTLDSTYGDLITTLTSERNRLLDDVAQADRRMGTLGNLASFVVAFLLPTSAIFIYRQLARRPRRQVELEHELEMLRRTERDRSQSLRLGLSHFDAQIDANDAPAVIAEAERLSATSALLYGQHTYDVARLPMGETLATIAADSGCELTVEASAHDLALLADPNALRLALCTLADGASNRKASRIHISGRSGPAAGKVELLSDAEPIPPLLAREAFLEATELTGVESQQMRELVLARTLLEGMGARITYTSNDEYEKFEITVPRAARPRANAPVAATADPT